MRKILFYLNLFAGVILISLTACKDHSRHDKAVFSLKRGNYWKYQGSYNGKPVSCGIVVHDIRKAGNLTYALMQGFPADVMDGEDWESSVWGLLASGNERYYKVSGSRIDSITRRLSEKESIHSGLVSEAELFMEALYDTGQIFGETDQLTRDDGNYIWKVTGKRAFEPTSIKGLKILGPFDCYTLIYKTVADETIMDLVPGIGIVRYRYSHHGTPAELDMKLVEAGIQ